jgi:hypothetical protein
MKIGYANEDPAGWILPYVEQDNLFGPAFTYDVLSVLNSAFVKNPNGRVGDLALRLAKQGDETGNAGLENAAVAFYLSFLTGGVHQSLTRSNSQILGLWTSVIQHQENP